MTSIRNRLLLWLIVGLFSTTIAAAFAVYTLAREEAKELFDYHLQQIAAAFPNEGLGPDTKPSASDPDMGNIVVVQIWDLDGVQLYVSRAASALPRRAEPGFSTVTSASGEWRVYTTLVGNNIVQVGHPVSVRQELAAAMALRTILPLLVLLPILAVFVWFTVGHGLRPLSEVAFAIGKRSADALAPLHDETLPREVKPLVAALNDLLSRLGRSLDIQRSFIADAAHELRTPLTAVKLQTQLAERAASDTERAAAFTTLKAGAERASRLVQQLLTLARNEPNTSEDTLALVNLADVARNVVIDQAAIAGTKGIDLGVSSAEPVSIMGDPDALRVMLGNLVDNAVRYTPGGGAVDLTVAMHDGQPLLTVTDSGPGIPAAERERVFDRFYRREGTSSVAGSGLGLAIVRKVAQRHHASVELDEGGDSHGLKVTVRFPRA